jgi:HEPN domain-containing protein
MLDFDKHIAYWRDGAVDDWESAEVLVARGKIRQGLFFAHLALEKALKAHVVKATGEIPPRTHSLRHLSELGQAAPDDEQLSTLLVANEFNIAGRYPESWAALPAADAVGSLMSRMHGVLQWLLGTL